MDGRDIVYAYSFGGDFARHFRDCEDVHPCGTPCALRRGILWLLRSGIFKEEKQPFFGGLRFALPPNAESVSEKPTTEHLLTKPLKYDGAESDVMCLRRESLPDHLTSFFIPKSAECRQHATIRVSQSKGNSAGPGDVC